MKKIFKRLIKLIFILWMAALIFSLVVPVELNLPGRSQYPALPNGCEAVSTQVALDGLGFSISAEDFARNYLPKAAEGNANPEDAYIGDPFGAGYYCYPKALVTGINQYLQMQNTSLRASTHRLVPFTEVLVRLHRDQPVIAWTTVNDKNATRSESVVWQINGEEYHPYTNLHVVVIDGVKNFQVHLVDSVNGNRWMPITKFVPLYYSMGLRAVYFTN